MLVGASYEDLFRNLPSHRNNIHPFAAWQQLIPRRQVNTRFRQPTRVGKPLSRTSSPQSQGLVRRRTTQINHRPTMPHPTSSALEQNVIERPTRVATSPLERPASWHPGSGFPNFTSQDMHQPSIYNTNVPTSQCSTDGLVPTFNPNQTASSGNNNLFETIQQPFNFVDYSQPTHLNTLDWRSQLPYNSTNSFFTGQSCGQVPVQPAQITHQPFIFDSYQPSAHNTELPVLGSVRYLEEQQSDVLENTEKDQVEEVGNDLVGLGLYDSSENTVRWIAGRSQPSNFFQYEEPSQIGKGLKLEEAWQPTSEPQSKGDDDEAEGEEEDGDGEAETEDEGEIESLVADDASQRQPSFDQERVTSFNTSLDYSGVSVKMPYTLPTTLNDYTFYFENDEGLPAQEWFPELQKVPAATVHPTYNSYRWF